MNVLDDPSLMNINSNVSRGNSAHEETSNSQIDRNDISEEE